MRSLGFAERLFMGLGKCFNGELVIGGLVVFQGEPGKTGQPGYRGDEGPAGPEVRSQARTCARAHLQAHACEPKDYI